MKKTTKNGGTGAKENLQALHNRCTIGLIQNETSKNIHTNLAKTLSLVEQAIENGAQIICLQELYKTIYFPQYQNLNKDDFAEATKGESYATFSRLAKEHGVVIIVPIYEKTEENIYYNSALVIDSDGQLLPVYHKIHIPNDPNFYEAEYFTKGATYQIYKTKFATFAVLICYDQWFPEAARIMTLQGADIIFYPTAIGNIKDYVSPDGDWHDAWETVMRGHAIANGTHIAAINRVGAEDNLIFWGQSFVCDAFGKVLARASQTQEQALVYSIDLAFNKRIREGWRFLYERRPDTYGALTDLRFKKPQKHEHE